jgi:hypothetical protein
MLSELQKRLRHDILTSKYSNPLITYQEFVLAKSQPIDNTIPDKYIFLYCKFLKDCFDFDTKFIELE